MADVTLKLTIDGKEAIQTLNLTDEQLKRLRGDLENIKNQKVKTQIEAEMKGMNPEQIRALYSNLKKELQEKIKMSIPDQELGELKTKLSAVEEAMQGVAEQGDKSTGGLIDGFGKLGLAINGVQQVLSIVGSVIGKPLEVAGQFEKYAVTLKVMLGSEEEASKRMAEYVKIGATTPFELSEVVELGNGLQALGKYSEETVIMMGDLAAASGKPLEMVKNAYTKLVTGEVGMAKQMFRDLLITAGDWEKATGKANATAEEMEKALPKILAMKGFGGMMEEQSKTLEGVKSNFEDTISGLMNDVGQDILPIAKEVFGTLINGISFVRENLDTLSPAITVISIAIASWAVATAGSVAMDYAKALSLSMVTNATKTWTATLLANPIALITTLVAGLVIGIGMLTSSMGENAKEMLENKSAQIALQEEEIKTTESKKLQAEATQNLSDRYIELSEKTVRTAEEQKEYETIITKLNQKYPAIIQSGDSFANNLARIKTQAQLTKTDIDKYTESIIALQKEMKQLTYDEANLKIGAKKKELEDALVNDNTGFFKVLTNISESVFSSSTARNQAEEFITQFSSQIYSSQSQDAINNALRNLQNKMKDEFGEEYATQQSNALTKAKEMAKERENLLKLKGIIKPDDTSAGEIKEDLTKSYDTAGKTIGDITERIKKLKDAQDGLIPKSKEYVANLKEISRLENALGTKKSGGGSKKTFADDLKKLEESYNTSLFKMQELDKASKEDLLKAEKKFIEDKILLYREYDKDKTPLIVELKTVITQLDIIEEEKFIKERKDSRNKNQNLGMMEQLEKDVNPNYKAPLTDAEKKRNKEILDQEAELRDRKEKFRISQMDNEFDRQRAMVDFEAQAELDKYKNYSNYAQMKLQIDSETADAKKKINEAENGAQISMAKETLGILAGMVNENTALGKGIAIAQATINTYEGATKALAQGGIWGAIQMAVVIASGMAQVQKIMSTEMPQMKGYERGGVIVGENGMEIIAPAQDYASGQARLIDAVINQMGGAGENARMESLFMGFYARLESWQTNMQFQIRRGDLYSAVQKETFNRNRRAL